MQDFDIERNERKNADLQFRIGGEEFECNPGVRPEVIARWGSVMDVGEDDALNIFDSTILAFIKDEGDAHERWRRLREKTVDPITLADIEALIRWCIAATGRRPFEQSSDFTGGPASTGPSLTDVSFSPDLDPASAT